MKTRTQTARILDYLCTNKPLTPLVALRRFGTFRLAARIHEIRADGHKVNVEHVRRGGAVVAQYRLAR